MESVTSPADRPDQIAVAFSGDLGALVGDREAATGSRAEIVARVAALEAERHPRWVWWAAADTAAPLVRAGIRIDRCWDVLEVHRLVRGGWHTDPTLAWAHARGLDPAGLPRHAGGDLFDFVGGATEDAGDPDSPVRADGYLRPEAVGDGWLTAPERLRAWAALALEAASLQQQRLATSAPARVVRTAHSESAAALLCLELERDGLPIDRPTAGAAHRRRGRAPARETRPTPRASAASATRPCCAHAPGRRGHRPAQPRAGARRCSPRWASTCRTPAHGVLEPFRGTHPLVEALLTWRKAERIATTYGYRWLDAHVGPDDRLRGGWTRLRRRGRAG